MSYSKKLETSLATLDRWRKAAPAQKPKPPKALTADELRSEELVQQATRTAVYAHMYVLNRTRDRSLYTDDQAKKARCQPLVVKATGIERACLQYRNECYRAMVAVSGENEAAYEARRGLLDGHSVQSDTDYAAWLAAAVLYRHADLEWFKAREASHALYVQAVEQIAGVRQ